MKRLALVAAFAAFFVAQGGWAQVTPCSKDPECAAAQKGVPPPMPPASRRATFDEEDHEPAPMKKPRSYLSGTPTSTCGCWGPKMPRASQPEPDCRSGYQMAVPCEGTCPAGGPAWRTICR